MIIINEPDRPPVQVYGPLDAVCYVEDRAAEIWGALVDPNEPFQPMPALDWSEAGAEMELPNGRLYAFRWACAK